MAVFPPHTHYKSQVTHPDAASVAAAALAAVPLMLKLACFVMAVFCVPTAHSIKVTHPDAASVAAAALAAMLPLLVSAPTSLAMAMAAAVTALGSAAATICCHCCTSTVCM
jgi:hypothetical protein